MSSQHRQDRDFEDWLSRQTHLALESERGPRPRPDQARYRNASMSRGRVDVMTIKGIGAALGLNAVAGGAAIVLAAGAAAGTMATGSMNPVNWGQRISETVVQCKQQVEAKGQPRNVGQCVSAIAKQHGEQIRQQHAESAEGMGEPRPSTGAKPGERRGQMNGSAAADDNIQAEMNAGQAAASHGQAGSHGSAEATGQSAAADHSHGKPVVSASPRS